MAYYDQRCCTIRHVQCSWKLPESASGVRCQTCVKYRSVLRSALSKLTSQDQRTTTSCDPSSHTNYRYLSTPEKVERLKNLHDVVRSKERQIQYLKRKVDDIVQAEGIKVDEGLHKDLVTIMKKNKPDENATERKFKEIFWQQQLKAATLKNFRSMRWHPAIIRWCLYLQHRSSGCYSTLRNSGVLTLPSDRTLRDYKHCVPAVCGFATTADQQLFDAVKQQKPVHLAHYVNIVFDEMYVKEGLVFDKATGSLTGFEDLREVNNLLAAAEQRFKDPDNVARRPLAKCMLVIMIRGLFNSLKFPYCQFPATSTKGSQLFPLLRHCIFRLTLLGLVIVSMTCDGASDNRRMFSLHGVGRELSNKTLNVFTEQRSPIFFVSDPSHLIKTIRNCFSRGKLWVSQYILSV